MIVCGVCFLVLSVCGAVADYVVPLIKPVVRWLDKMQRD